MKTTRFFAMLAAAAVVFACNKPEPEPQPAPGPQGGDEDPVKEATITVNTTSSTFKVAAEGEEISFQVLANYDWEIAKSNLDWVEISPLKGEADDLVTVKLAVSANEGEARTGTFTISIPGKDASKVFTVEQAAAGSSPANVLAKWTWSALWYNEEPSAPTNKTNILSAAGKASAQAWINKQPVVSDVVAGGSFGFVSTSAGVTYTHGPATHKKNRLRVAYINTEDYFWFKLDNVKLEKNAVITLHNAYIQVANIDKGGRDYRIDWSKDNTNWTKVKDIHVNTEAANAPESLECSVVLPEALDGSFWLRIAIAGKVSASGKDLEEGGERLCFISTDDSYYPVTNSYDTRDAFYDEDWAYVWFEAGAPGSGPTEPDPTLTVSKDAIEFDAVGAKAATFSVRSNYDWTLSASDLGWATVEPVSGPAGENVTVTVTPQDNPDSEVRSGKITVSVNGKNLTKDVTISQKGKPAEAKVVAKWTWSALYSAADNTCTAGQASAKSWEGGNAVASDKVAGGAFSFVSTCSTIKRTTGTSTQVKNRFRVANLNTGDYFQFKIDDLDLKAGTIISFHNAYVQVANVSKGGKDYAIEWSSDGSSWTKVKDIQVDAAAANTPATLDCEITLSAALKGSFYLRVAVAGAVSANGTALSEGGERLCFITTNDKKYPGTTTEQKNAFYDEDWAYIYFDVR